MEFAQKSPYVELSHQIHNLSQGTLCAKIDENSYAYQSGVMKLSNAYTNNVNRTTLKVNAFKCKNTAQIKCKSDEEIARFFNETILNTQSLSFDVNLNDEESIKN